MNSTRVCVFGSYADNDLYQRNRILAQILMSLGDESFCVRPSMRPQTASNHSRTRSLTGIMRLVWEQVTNFFSLWRQRKRLQQADLFFIPYPAYIDYWALVLLTLWQPRRPVVVDAFLCLHDTLVDDRKMVKPGSILAWLVEQLEKQALQRADCVLIDTPQQRDQLRARYGLSKLCVVPVGLDERQWQPLPMPVDSVPFRVLFWGTFIPLHGVDTIIAAAKKLQSLDNSIEFCLVGEGQTADACAQLLQQLEPENLEWRRQLVDTSSLRELIASSHCVLGVFGSGEKAGSVIPYKAHQALASNRVLVSREGPAMAHLQCEDVILVPPQNADALAEAIISVKQKLSEGRQPVSRELFDRYLSNGVIRRELAEMVESING